MERLRRSGIDSLHSGGAHLHGNANRMSNQFDKLGGPSDPHFSVIVVTARSFASWVSDHKDRHACGLRLVDHMTQRLEHVSLRSVRHIKMECYGIRPEP